MNKIRENRTWLTLEIPDSRQHRQRSLHRTPLSFVSQADTRKCRQVFNSRQRHCPGTLHSRSSMTSTQRANARYLVCIGDLDTAQSGNSRDSRCYCTSRSPWYSTAIGILTLQYTQCHAMVALSAQLCVNWCLKCTRDGATVQCEVVKPVANSKGGNLTNSSQ